jgi:Alpha/beta hydrolase family
MVKRFLVLVAAAVLPAFALAAVVPYPATFQTKMVPTNGTSLYVRVGGKGPAVVLLHGFADTGDMWAPLAAVLVRDHTVIVPDLRGMGLSAHPDTGYTKKNQALDIAGVMGPLDHGGESAGDRETHCWVCRSINGTDLGRRRAKCLMLARWHHCVACECTQKLQAAC